MAPSQVAIGSAPPGSSYWLVHPVGLIHRLAHVLPAHAWCRRLTALMGRRLRAPLSVKCKTPLRGHLAAASSATLPSANIESFSSVAFSS